MNIWVCNVVVMKMSVHYFLSNQFCNLRKMELRIDFTTSQVLNLQFDDVVRKLLIQKLILPVIIFQSPILCKIVFKKFVCCKNLCWVPNKLVYMNKLYL